MTTPLHLDQPTFRRLLSGEVGGEEARSLAAHLDEPCETCEAALAGLEGADALDGLVDRALAGGPPRPGEQGNDVEWARIRRRLAGPRARVWRAVAAAGAATALVLLAGVVALLRMPSGPDAPVAGSAWDGAKGGEAVAVVARLRFSVAHPGAGPGQVVRGESGAAVPADASLLFRVEASGPAALALLRLGPDGGEVVWEGRAPAAGSMDVEVGGRIAAFPLRGLAGRQRFALIAAPALGFGRVEAARRALASGSAPPSDAGVALDVVEVTVR